MFLNTTGSNMVPFEASKEEPFLSAEEYQLIRIAFTSIDADGTGIVSLSEALRAFNPYEHPRVKEGTMSPSEAKDRLRFLFESCAAEKRDAMQSLKRPVTNTLSNSLKGNSAGAAAKGAKGDDDEKGITFDEFLRYHLKLVTESYKEQVPNVSEFIKQTVVGLWRLGDLLLPTGIRPLFDIHAAPEGIYAHQPMTLVWAEPNPNYKYHTPSAEELQLMQEEYKNASRGKSGDSSDVEGDERALQRLQRQVYYTLDNSGEPYVLKALKDAVLPHFKRGDLPEEIQGLFAYPAELQALSHNIIYLPPAVAVQKYNDFLWEYEEGKLCGMKGVVASLVKKENLPESIAQFIFPSGSTKYANVQYINLESPATQRNPIYKTTSGAYGFKAREAAAAVDKWKFASLSGRQRGNRYWGLVGHYFSSQKVQKLSSVAATGMNI